MSEEEGKRGPEQAIEEIREKREDEEPSRDEREFLESEGVKLDPDEGGGRPVA